MSTSDGKSSRLWRYTIDLLLEMVRDRLKFVVKAGVVANTGS